MDERAADVEERKLWPTAVERHFIEVLLEEDAKGNIPQGQFKSGTWTAVTNEFNKRTNKAFQFKHSHGFPPNVICPTSSNSDEERELDAAFLSEGVHVNVNIDGVDDMEKLPTPSEAQSRRQAEKRPCEPSNSSEKRRKGHSLESMTEAIWGFTEMRNRGGKKSTNTGESGVGADSESITQAVTLLNQHTNVDHVTYCKIVQELHNAKSRAAFFAMTVDRRRAWIEFIGGGL
nr:hypothetical protein CFP56_61255 [Quercus suber]